MFHAGYQPPLQLGAPVSNPRPAASLLSFTSLNDRQMFRREIGCFVYYSVKRLI